MTSATTRQSVQECLQIIRQRWGKKPSAGIVLGTGMGPLTEEIDADLEIDYAEIPGFPKSTALGHKGRFVCGVLAGMPVIAMDGRFHVYEGYSFSEITLPIHVMHGLGISSLLLSNAAGGLNPQFSAGDIVVIDDHINLIGSRNLSNFGETRVEWRGGKQGTPYDLDFIRQALFIARRENFTAHRGVYVSVSGPNYETRAEYRFLRTIGGDVVGMSTVPEVIVSALYGLRTLALSTVTNVCRPDAPLQVAGEEVLLAAEKSAPNVCKIVRQIIAGLKKEA